MNKLLKYALNEDNMLVHIKSVEKGLKCKCICPSCRQPLVAKNKGEYKTPHFAHKSGYDCPGARMTALHMLAQQILKKEKTIMLPEYYGEYIKKESLRITFDEVSLEEPLEIQGKNFRIDCVGYKQDKDNKEHRLLVEILVTHKVDEEKRRMLESKGESCIEIDLSDLLDTDYTAEKLTLSLKNSSCYSKWINCPVYDKLEEQKKKEEEERKRAERERRRTMSDIVNKWFKEGDSKIANDIIHSLEQTPYISSKNHCNQKRPNSFYEFLAPDNDYMEYILKSPKNNDGLNLFYTLLRFYYNHALSADYNKIKKMLKNIQYHKVPLTDEEKIYYEELVSLRTIRLMAPNMYSLNVDNNLIKAYIKDVSVRKEVLMVSSVVFHHIIGSEANSFGELTKEIIQSHPSIASSYLAIIDAQTNYRHNYFIGNHDMLNELRTFVDNLTKQEDCNVDRILRRIYSYAFVSEMNGYEIDPMYQPVLFIDEEKSKRLKEWDEWYYSLGCN